MAHAGETLTDRRSPGIDGVELADVFVNPGVGQFWEHQLFKLLHRDRKVGLEVDT